MSALDPQVLIHTINELGIHLNDWVYRLRDSLLEIESCQRCAEEVASRTQHNVDLAWNQAQDDIILAKNQKRVVEETHARADNAVSDAHELYNRSRAKQQYAKKRLDYWTGELTKARDWLNTALARENLAQGQFLSAEQKLSIALSELHAAKDELASACHRKEYAGQDSQGNSIYRSVDLGRYKIAVESAQTDVDHCKAQLEYARHELRAAIADRKAAEARITVCEKSVSRCHEAVSSAGKAVEYAHNALVMAERGLEEANRGLERADQGIRYAQEEIDIAEEMKQDARQATQRSSDGRLKFNAALEYVENAQLYVVEGCRVLEERTWHLRKFDTPTTINP
uniref:Uncharacterized protein n=1 Tax=Candidatus Kentrum sp. LPFa TaxID=2126335 RepID=A0A450WDJ5_9GAMM|nr:MAG: hypothetical protein BECKLPF1236B_GA0070989_10724 [Candidatus Kentron sp. LPFa]